MFEELNKVNTNGVMPEDLNCDGFEYKKISEFAGRTIIVDGFYFNEKGSYGKEVVVVGAGCKINMPKRAVKSFEEIMKNPEMKKAVLGRHLAIAEIKCDVDTPKGKTTSFKFIDC